MVTKWYYIIKAKNQHHKATQSCVSSWDNIIYIIAIRASLEAFCDHIYDILNKSFQNQNS